MSFDEEWARHKADAQAEQDVGTRLDSAGGGDRGTKKKLHVTPSVLRGRAGKAENKAAKEFRDAHKSAVTTTSEVPGSMRGFSCDEAFADFITSWKKGAAYVAGQIGKDGLATALRSAADSFDDEEDERKKSFKKEYTYKPGDVI
ncbi:type VII secretion target [Streptomyces sp. NRRL F-5135]|uniref:type VII secretion target n=1 Tax=Streptomyces sp. NRRL F-5135 TaxID=1463858 RepID=UPI0004C85F83|nr:type VII secretion target [Streptomyces sp. NRRL F-5135]